MTLLMACKDENGDITLSSDDVVTDESSGYMFELNRPKWRVKDSVTGDKRPEAYGACGDVRAHSAMWNMSYDEFHNEIGNIITMEAISTTIVRIRQIKSGEWLLNVWADKCPVAEVMGMDMGYPHFVGRPYDAMAHFYRGLITGRSGYPYLDVAKRFNILEDYARSFEGLGVFKRQIIKKRW